MHIGSLRVALYNYIISKQKNEDLIIRIENLNDNENKDNFEKEILETLSLFSIDYTRVVSQSESLKYHQKMVMQLLTNKKAFVCFCSSDKINELKEEAKKEGRPYSYDGFCETLSDETVLNTNAPFCIRIKKPDNTIIFKDLLNGEITLEPKDADSVVILEQDKMPTYNYACAVDDMILDISTVIRDKSHLLNTYKQINIRSKLSYDKEIDYIHLPSITNSDITVKSLIDDGFLPSAIANYLILLGNETPNEIFTLEEAIKWLNIESISKDEVEFDIDKLKSINKSHLEMLDDMRLSKILGFADTDIGKLAKIFLKESNTIKELKNNIEDIFSQKSTLISYEKEFVEIKVCLNDAPYFENFDELIKYIKDKTNLEGESLLKPLTYLLTKKDDQIDISQIYPLIKNYLREIVK
jgi:glutamyl-tRNA synthetase